MLAQKAAFETGNEPVDRLLRHAVEAFEPERRLSGASIAVETVDGPPTWCGSTALS